MHKNVSTVLPMPAAVPKRGRGTMRGGTKGDVTFFSEESNKEPVCDVNADWVKLEGSTGICCVKKLDAVIGNCRKIRPTKRLPLGGEAVSES